MDIQDLLYRGAMEQERSNDAVGQFNERRQRLGNIHDDITEVLGNLNGDDYDALMPHIEEVLTWQKEINENLDQAQDKHLSEYATHLKNTAMLAIELCKKYEIYGDIKSFEYIEQIQLLKLNGVAFYFFG